MSDLEISRKVITFSVVTTYKWLSLVYFLLKPKVMLIKNVE